MDGHSRGDNDGAFLLSLLGYNDGSHSGDGTTNPLLNLRLCLLIGLIVAVMRYVSLAPYPAIMRS